MKGAGLDFLQKSWIFDVVRKKSLNYNYITEKSSSYNSRKCVFKFVFNFSALFDNDIRYLLWIAHQPRTFRQSVGYFQGVHSQTASYHEITSDERIRSSKSHNLIRPAILDYGWLQEQIYTDYTTAPTLLNRRYFFPFLWNNNRGTFHRASIGDIFYMKKKFSKKANSGCRCTTFQYSW